jgi:hypothetical protein
MRDSCINLGGIHRNVLGLCIITFKHIIYMNMGIGIQNKV